MFRRNGLAVLLYDHRNLGFSDGEPRQEINPWIQCRGYLDAIDLAQTLDGVDRHRVGLWGDSYSGGQVLVVGAVDHRVGAIVAQVPVCGSHPPELEPSQANFEHDPDLPAGRRRGRRPRRDGGTPARGLPGPARTPSLLEPIQAFRWFIDRGARHGTGWFNHVTRVVPDTAVPYSPVLCAPYVTAPTLMMVAPNDEMKHANYDVSRLAYDLMPAPKQWYDIAGGHFGLLYHPSPLFDEATRTQTSFLERSLTSTERR